MNTGREPSQVAKLCAGNAPKKGCSKCKGSGFYYANNWARTCICKLPSKSRAEVLD